MKQVLVLVAGVAILVAAWFAVGMVGSNPEGQAYLTIPEDASDKSDLLRSAHQLWRARPGYYDPLRCAALIERLVGGLDDEHWHAAADPVLFAWKHLRAVPSARDALASLGERTFARIVRSSSISNLETLISLAKTHSADRAAINRVLDAMAAESIPSTGFTGSRLSLLIGAAVRAKEFGRAKEFLAMAKWDESLRSDMESAVSRSQALLDLCLASEASRFDFPKIVRSWSEHDRGPVDRTIFRNALEGIALGILGSFDPVRPKVPLAEFYSCSTGEPAGMEYWEKVILRSLESCSHGNEAKNGAISILLDLHEGRLKRPGYAFEFWVKAAERATLAHPKDSVRAARLYERAFAVAPHDEGRILALRAIMAGYSRANELERARAAGERALGIIKNPVSTREAETLLEAARQKCAEEDARQAKVQKGVEQDRRRGRLSNLKEMLAHAKKMGRPAGEISAIETSIKEMERLVTE